MRLFLSECFGGASSSEESKHRKSSVNKTTPDPDQPESSVLVVRTLRNNAHAFSYRDLSAATQGFSSSNKIGEGAFGSVYKGRLVDGRTVAVKVLSVESRQGEREFMSEIASLCNVRHENLVTLYGGCVHGAKRLLVYEHMPNNSLVQTYLGGKGNKAKFSWEIRRKVSIGIAQGLAHVHEEIRPRIIHRDIKASNILLDQNFTPKISDFGLSKLFPEHITHLSTRVAGTIGYLAPEYALSGHLTRKSDVYSFGVQLLEIISGRPVIDFDLERGEHYLVEKAWEMYKEGKLIELVDPALKSKFPATEALRFLQVGLLCVQETIGLRPNMSSALKMMTGTEDIELKISEPGRITSIMDVQILGKKQRPFSANLISMCTPKLYPFY